MTSSTRNLTVSDGTAVLHLDRLSASRGRCLVVPPFGVPASAMAVLSDALAAHHLEAARLDPRNHVGDGSGTIATFTLSGFAADCAEAIERFRPSCVLALSMGARAVLRALASTSHRTTAVLALPVIDVRSTLATVLGTDWFEPDAPEPPGIVEVLDAEVRAPEFRRDCQIHDLASALGTERDLLAIRGPVTLLPGADDPWVSSGGVLDLAERVRRRGRTVEARTVACDRHDLHNDLLQALAMVEVLAEEANGIHPAEAGVAAPGTAAG